MRGGLVSVVPSWAPDPAGEIGEGHIGNWGSSEEEEVGGFNAEEELGGGVLVGRGDKVEGSFSPLWLPHKGLQRYSEGLWVPSVGETAFFPDVFCTV